VQGLTLRDPGSSDDDVNDPVNAFYANVSGTIRDSADSILHTMGRVGFGVAVVGLYDVGSISENVAAAIPCSRRGSSNSSSNSDSDINSTGKSNNNNNSNSRSGSRAGAAAERREQENSATILGRLFDTISSLVGISGSWKRRIERELNKYNHCYWIGQS